MKFTDWSKLASNMNEHTQILKEEEEIYATVQSSETLVLEVNNTLLRTTCVKNTSNTAFT